MTTLTDFLLARITEDEKAARLSIPAGGRRAGKTFWRRRVVECEAKRAIVEEFAKQDQRNSLSEQTWQAWHLITLTLAQVYADHPDYDPAWSA